VAVFVVFVLVVVVVVVVFVTVVVVTVVVTVVVEAHDGLVSSSGVLELLYFGIPDIETLILVFAQ